MKNSNTQDPGFLASCRLVCLLMVMLLAAGCASIKFTYNNGDTLTYWWLNAYLDLDSEQSRFVKHDIDDLFQWHRKTQLKDYAQILTAAQRQLAGTMTKADLAADYRDIKARSELLALKAVPDLADLARTVRPEQITQMEKKFNSNNEKYRKKFLKGDLATRQKVRYQKAMEQMELWFGDFSSDQEAALRAASDARPMDGDIWLDERMIRQKRILTVLRKVQQEKLGKEATEAQLTSLIKELFGRLESPERKQFFDAFFDGNANMILTAVKIATPAQKAHAQKRMQGWITDFNALAADTK